MTRIVLCLFLCLVCLAQPLPNVTWTALTTTGTGAATGVFNTGMGSNVLFDLTSGDDNSGLGVTACIGVTTGSRNTCLGSHARLNTSGITTSTNQTVVGAFTDGAGSNTVVIGNASVTDVYFGSSATPNAKIHANGGSAGKATCWKADGKTLGFCSDVVGVTGGCTCN